MKNDDTIPSYLTPHSAYNPILLVVCRSSFVVRKGREFNVFRDGKPRYHFLVYHQAVIHANRIRYGTVPWFYLQGRDESYTLYL